MFRYLPAILIGKLARVLIRVFRKGGGSALPGLMLSRLAPGLLYKTLNSFPLGLVIVTGSAGKSTTTKMLVALVRSHGISVFTNPSTANILQGFYSTIVEKSSMLGRLRADVAILEMDEAHASSLTNRVVPKQVTILNVMEDQLDRFVDPSLVRSELSKVAQVCSGAVILNADDQNTVMIGQDLAPNRVHWFGISHQVAALSRHGLGNAPTYLPALPRPKVSTEAVALNGEELLLERRQVSYVTKLPNRGAHFALDAAAAFESAAIFLGEKFDPQKSAQVLAELPPVFARGERVSVRGHDVEFNLVQNPGSMQLNIDALVGEPDQILFAIGRDVHDPSWLWTVDYSNLRHVKVVTGFNAAEAALVLEYHSVTYDRVIEDLDEALDYFFALPTPARGIKTVLFSADAMRRTRRALGFWTPETAQS